MKILMTGGHHTSALPIINLIFQQHKDIELIWAGHKYSMKENKNPTLEYKDITNLGIKFLELKAGKLYRTYDPLQWLKIPFGFFQALYFLIKIKPDLIISFGGYLAVPIVLAAWFLRIPSVTHEQTVIVGYANKFISHFVKKVFISWPKSQDFFPADKVVFAGLPLRQEIFSIKSNSFEATNNLPYVYITAGKTGSHLINMLIKDALVELLGFCNVIHQCGDHSQFSDYENLQQEYESIKSRTHINGKYFLRKFVLENEIGEALNRAELLISRSGAHITAEILVLNKKAILIPISWVSHNEQNLNAQMVVEAGLGKVLSEISVSSSDIINNAKQMLSTTSNSNNVNIKTINKDLVRNSAEIILNESLKLLSSR